MSKNITPCAGKFIGSAETGAASWTRSAADGDDGARGGAVTVAAATVAAGGFGAGFGAGFEAGDVPVACVGVVPWRVNKEILQNILQS